MIRKFLLPLLSLAGILFAVFSVVRSAKVVPPAQPVAMPSVSSFSSYVAGSGILEASTENIAIGTPVGNIVTEILVKVGDRVSKGDPLFKLRDQVTQAELESKKSALNLANAKLEKLKSLPRPEDLPPLEAKVKESEAGWNEQKNVLGFWESVTDQRAVSKEVLSRQRSAVEAAGARLAAARAELEVLRAGAWKPDLRIAETEIEAAQSAVKQVEAEIERRTIRAPVDGMILQVKVRPGEYAQPGPLDTPLMLLGGVEDLHVRVDIDENDAWRIKPEARAEAVVRGNPRLKTTLELVRIEPYVLPKRSLTGESTERVDTRVLQVLYRFRSGALPVYVGQQMDIFIEAPAVEADAANPADAQNKVGAAK